MFSNIYIFLIWYYIVLLLVIGVRFNFIKGYGKIVNFVKNRLKRVSRKKSLKYEIINNIYFKIYGYKNILF